MPVESTESHVVKRRSIAARILVVLLLASLVPLLAVAVLNAVRSLNAVEAVARANLQQIARTTAAQLDQLIEDTTYDLQFLTGDHRVRDVLTARSENFDEAFEEAMQVLANISASNVTYASAFIADAEGIGVASPNPKNIGMDLTFREYMQEALAGRSYISDMLVGKTTGESGIYFSGPVRDDDGVILGAVVIKLRGDRVRRLIQSVTNVNIELRLEDFRDLRDSIAAIIDSNGVVISATDPLDDFLFHSLVELPEELQNEIDPQRRWGVPTIVSLEVPELANEMLGQEDVGCVIVPGNEGKSVVGFAKMERRDWYVCISEPLEEFIAPLVALAKAQLLGAVILGVLAGFIAVFQARQIVGPISQLTQAVLRLSEGNFDTRVEIDTRDEIQLLADSFNNMAPKLQEHVRMSESLALANEIQQNLLPSEAPEIPGLDIAGINLPCDETGGDYFDFIDFRDDSPTSIDLTIGDVTGHGVPAALLMTSGRALLRAGAARGEDLSQMIEGVNDRLVSDTLDGRFMTLFYLTLDSESRSASWVSAGHDPAALYDTNADTFEELVGEGFPLGIVPEADYPTSSRDDLKPGQVIVIGTDGIWEAHNADGEMFGKDRVGEIIRKSKALPAKTIAEAILGAVLDFRGDLQREDDITVVVVRLT